MFNAHRSVQDGLDHLATRLDPLIAGKLATVLNGLSWTVVLRELDQAKGHVGKESDPQDLQAQLRMLTERLGGLKYPFDDPATRVVSTLGGELRIMRNRWAHNYQLSTLDAWRTHDFVIRLLEHFQDALGVAIAEEFRMKAFKSLAEESGIVPEAVSRESTIPHPHGIEKEELGEQVPGVPEHDDEHVVPDPIVLVRQDHSETPTIGRGRSEFEPWVPILVGGVAVLDDLPKKVAKEQVRAVAVEIAQFEGPIHIDRLVQLTAASFGVNRVHFRRSQKIIRQIKAAGLMMDQHKFVWPESIDRNNWDEFRPNGSGANRSFLQISPIEIANAVKFLQQNSSALTQEDFDTQTLQTFGRKRRTKQIAQHLALARTLLET